MTPNTTSYQADRVFKATYHTVLNTPGAHCYQIDICLRLNFTCLCANVVVRLRHISAPLLHTCFTNGDRAVVQWLRGGFMPGIIYVLELFRYTWFTTSGMILTTSKCQQEDGLVHETVYPKKENTARLWF